MGQAGRRPWKEAGDAQRVAATVPLNECLCLSRVGHRERTVDDESDPPCKRGTPPTVLEAQRSKGKARLM